MTDLAGDVADYDEATASTIGEILQRILAFQAETASDMEDIDMTLEELAKLDTILADLDELASSLGETEQDLDSSVKEVSDEQLSASSTNMILLIVVIVLTLIVIVLVFRMQKRKSYY
ncbi:MAG: hypothetical protein GWN18_17820 [Thermoplasmata archaeon]|nr:YueC family protein [Thermoplasmata archaeon]NIS13983.1 YueC family protein [Thermoplasmata archaeon]NIU50853.1 YueC family protein [Thermoplasmata archaeon]NIW84376.1 hypothetical protein [Thermoplasmata archaeon]